MSLKTSKLISRKVLHKSREELRAITDHSPDVIARLDNQHRHIFINPSGEKVYGKTRKEIIGKTIAELGLPHDKVAFLEKNLREVFSTGQQKNIQFDFSSSYRHLNLFSALVPEKNENDETVSVLVITRDITEIKKVEKSLRESEERFRTLADNISQLAWMVDNKGRVFWYNKRWFDYTGTTLQEMRGQGWTKVHHPDHLDRVIKSIRYAFETGQSWEETFPLRNKEGNFRWFLSRALPVRDINNKIVRWLGTNTDITELRNAQEDLHQSQVKFKNVFDNAAIGIAEVDEEDKFISINKRFCEIVGYSEHELIGKAVYDITAPDDIVRSSEINKRIHNGELDFCNYEKRYVKKDGSYLWVHVSISAVDAQKKRTIRTVEDISARKAAEEALQESEERFSTMFRSLSIGVSLLTFPELVFYDVNEAWIELMGFNGKEEVLGRTVAEFGGLFREPAQREKVLKRLSEKGFVRNEETEVITTKGIKRIISVNIDLVYIKGRKFLLTTMPDITDLKYTEIRLTEALKEAEEGRNTLAALMEHIPVGIMISDADNKIRMVSRYGRNILGNSNEILNVPPRPEIFYSDDKTQVKIEDMPLSRAITRGEITKNEELFLRSSDGTHIPVLCNAAPILDNHDNVIGAVSGWQDISEIRQKRDELTRFIYTVSHDLKSPLFTVQSFINLLQEHIQKGDRAAQDRDIEYINNAISKMQQRVEELGELTKIGIKEKPKSVVPLKEIVREALELVEGSIKHKNVKVTYEFEDIILHCYKDRLVQLFQNLFDNAVKFMGDQPNPEIKIGSLIENNQIVLYVGDNGLGIDPRYHHKVFDLFEKLDNKAEGSGIGLSTVKRIVELHNGIIYVRSEGAGRGTTFYFTLGNYVSQADTAIT